MTEEILTYLNTGKFPEQARTVWNYTPLAWMLFLLITVIILSIFVLVREVRRKRIMKNHWKLVRILIHFVIPAIWLILVPMVYESSWGWLIASNPIINISILLIMAAFVLTGIGRVVIMRCKSC
jgi:membrane-associated HD superfamily phosphohydrolase